MNLKKDFRLLLVYCVILLSGCGIFRKSEKDKFEKKTETLVSTKIETDNQVVDLSTKKEIINVDTTLKTREKTIEQETKYPVTIDSLYKGMNVVRDGLVDIIIQIDSATGKLKTIATIKPQNVPFQYQKETTTQNNITTKEKKKETALAKTKDEEESKNKKTEPQNSFWLFAIIAGAVLIVVFFLYRRFKL